MFPSNWLKDKTKTLAIYHSSGPWKFALKSFRQDAWEIKPEKEKPTTPGNRPTSHNQSLAAEEHSSPITVSKQKLPKVTKHQDAADLPGFYHTTGSPRGRALGRCSRLYLASTPPARRLRVVAQPHASVSTPDRLLSGILS